jgi:hypothetical protein
LYFYRAVVRGVAPPEFGVSEKRTEIEIESLIQKSLYIKCAVSKFYGTEIEIWAGFRPVGSAEKKPLGRL